jgi:hypothetical protein
MKAIFWIGKCGLAGQLIRAFKRRGVSHAEILFSDGFRGTSVPGPGIVLRPLVVNQEDWVIIDLPCSLAEEAEVRAFFEEEKGCGYDWSGIIFAQVFGWNWASKTKYFCSEACIAGLQKIYPCLGDVRPCRVDPARELELIVERILAARRVASP